MKKILFLMVVATALIAGACSDNDDMPVTTVAALGGTWKLTHVSGSVAGIDQDFTPGAVTWTFNVENNTVSVVNNTPDDSLTDFFPTGNYTYGYVQNETTPQSCAYTLAVSNINFGCAASTSTTLTLTQVESDGYVLTFIR